MYTDAFQAVVGPQSRGNGDVLVPRAGNSGEVITGAAHARYYEPAMRGNLFHAATAVTGVAPGTAVGTTAAFSLYNPVASGVDLVILGARIAYVSGSLAAGVVNWVANVNRAAAATTGTAITAVNGKLDGAVAQGKPLTTATLPATPTVARVAFSIPPWLVTSVSEPWSKEDCVDGSIIVPPGCTVSLEATGGAGTTPLVVYSVLWEEVPCRS